MDNGQQPMRVHLTRGALEAPDVILLVQSHQGLAVSQQAVAAGTPVSGLGLAVAGDVDPVAVHAGLVDAGAGAGGAGHVGQAAPRAPRLILLRLKREIISNCLCVLFPMSSLIPITRLRYKE